MRVIVKQEHLVGHDPELKLGTRNIWTGNIADYGKLQLTVIGLTAGSITVSTAFTSGGTLTEKEVITADGSETIDLVSLEDNYISIDSIGLEGEIDFTFIVKKNSNVIITDVADIPTTDVGCIFLRLPELAAQGGSEEIDMCWSEALGRYAPKNKVLIYSSDINHTTTIGEIGVDVTIATLTMPKNIINSGLELIGFCSTDLAQGGSASYTRLKKGVTTIIRQTHPTTAIGVYMSSRSFLSGTTNHYSTLNSPGDSGINYDTSFDNSIENLLSIVLNSQDELIYDYKNIQVWAV